MKTKKYQRGASIEYRSEYQKAKERKAKQIAERLSKMSDEEKRIFRMTQKEREELKDNNLLKPGEDPGEGYKGSPDMYPDYEEDKKEMKYGGSSNKYKSGKFVTVKTKLGKTKPTKLC